MGLIKCGCSIKSMDLLLTCSVQDGRVCSVCRILDSFLTNQNCRQKCVILVLLTKNVRFKLHYLIRLTFVEVIDVEIEEIGDEFPNV